MLYGSTTYFGNDVVPATHKSNGMWESSERNLQLRVCPYFFTFI